MICVSTYPLIQYIAEDQAHVPSGRFDGATFLSPVLGSSTIPEVDGVSSERSGGRDLRRYLAKNIKSELPWSSLNEEACGPDEPKKGK